MAVTVGDVDILVPGPLGPTEGIIEFPEGEQPGIGGDPEAVEFQLEAAVKSEPQIGRSRFTRRISMSSASNRQYGIDVAIHFDRRRQ